MMVSALVGDDIALTCLGDVVNLTFSLGLDLSLFVLFCNHFFDFFASGGRFR